MIVGSPVESATPPEEPEAQAEGTSRQPGKPGTPGRPKGKSTEPAPEVEASATRCPRCQSTVRGAYLSYRELHAGGVDSRTRKKFTHTVWRRTRCECGQLRTDRLRENRVAAA